MSFNVTFYTFTKKANSTAQPSASGSTYACVGKNPLSVTNPRLQLKLADGAADNPAAWNYAYIPSFSRYYWVSEWTNSGPIWEASLVVDVLASWKTNIGNQSLYVYRSSHSYNDRVPDSAYPQKAIPQRGNLTLPKPWTIGGANAASAAANTGTIVAGIASENGTKYYAFGPGNWNTFLSYLFSDDYYEDVLSTFGATEYPEAKVAVNPLQFITSAIFVPLSVGSGNYQIPYASTTTHIIVGNVSVPASNQTSNYTAYVLSEDNPAPWTYTLVTVNDPPFVSHPQAATRGKWLNFAPYTEYELFYPPCGVIQLDPDIMSEAKTIVIRVYMDYKASKGMLEVVGTFTDAAPNYERKIYRGEFNIGAPIQLSNVISPGGTPSERVLLSDVSDAYGSIPSVIGNEPSGFVASGLYSAVKKIPIVGSMISNGVSSAVHGRIPRYSSTGYFGSTACMSGTPTLTYTWWILADEDNASKGRPLCEIRQLSTIPGFIVADPDDMSIPCTEPEFAEIQNAVSGGFFYE